MKRLALVAAVLAIAACTTKEEKAPDTAAVAPAPAPMDSMPMAKDSMMKDSTMKHSGMKDSAMAKPE